MVGKNHSKYHGVEIYCIVIYYGILNNIGIHKHQCSEIQNNSFSNNNALDRYIILPNNKTPNIIEKII